MNLLNLSQNIEDKDDKYTRFDYVRILSETVGGFLIVVAVFVLYNAVQNGTFSSLNISNEVTIFLGLIFVSPVLFAGIFILAKGLVEIVLLTFSILYTLQSQSR